jgi:hypothetical protein
MISIIVGADFLKVWKKCKTFGLSNPWTLSCTDLYPFLWILDISWPLTVVMQKYEHPVIVLFLNISCFSTLLLPLPRSNSAFRFIHCHKISHSHIFFHLLFNFLSGLVFTLVFSFLLLSDSVYFLFTTVVRLCNTSSKPRWLCAVNIYCMVISHWFISR